MPFSSSQLARTYTSFGGVDIKGVINGVPVANLQAISYAIQREKAPIYVMGRVDPLSFSRGKRGIAGTIITLMMDRHLLFTAAFQDMDFIADKDELFAGYGSLNLNEFEDTADLDTVGGAGFDPTGPFNSNEDIFQISKAWYVDQLPPFDVVILAQNEYGNSAQMRIYGIELLNEGSGFSIDDQVIENQSTYVARTILQWQKMGEWDFEAREFRGRTVGENQSEASDL